MRVFLIRRILYVVPVMFFISMMIFLMIRLLPGDVADVLLGGEDASADPAVRQMIIKEYGLDRPYLTQYGIWLGKVLRGDFGQSIHSKKPVAALLADKFPKTLLLAAVSILVSVAIALPAGVVAAVWRRTWLDYFAMMLSLIGVSLPNFWLAIMFILLFSLHLGWLPSITDGGALGDVGRMWPFLVLPALSLGTRLAGVVTRLTRSSMLDELGKDYVRTSRAKGLPGWVVIVSHALRNALLPTVTAIGLQFGGLLGGAVVIEQVFAWPGIGQLLVDSIFARDYPVVQGVILLVATSFVAVNLAVDMLYSWLNPRISLE